jgi:hypothetical protein
MIAVASVPVRCGAWYLVGVLIVRSRIARPASDDGAEGVEVRSRDLLRSAS